MSAQSIRTYASPTIQEFWKQKLEILKPDSSAFIVAAGLLPTRRIKPTIQPAAPGFENDCQPSRA
jgi:hypothetical protein